MQETSGSTAEKYASYIHFICSGLSEYGNFPMTFRVLTEIILKKEKQI
jgi:hypothetical protein